MRTRRLLAGLASAIALVFVASCSDGTAPDVLTADDADVLAAKPATPPGKEKQPPPDDPEHRHDIYFAVQEWGDNFATLCVVDNEFKCTASDFTLEWTTEVTEVDPRTHRQFEMQHWLEISWRGDLIGGLTTSNSITCRTWPCSTSKVRLQRKNWIPLEDDGLVMPYDGIINLVDGSELVDLETGVVFRPGDDGIYGRVVFDWTE